MDRQFLGIVVHPFWDTMYIKGLSKGRYGFVQVLSEPRTRTTRSNSSKQAWEVTSALRHMDTKQRKESKTSRKHSCAKYERGNETGHGGRAKRQEKSSLCMKERKLIDCWIDQEMKFFFPRYDSFIHNTKKWKDSPEHCGPNILFFFSPSPNKLLVRERYLNNSLRK